jgi:hypothetical protein
LKKYIKPESLSVSGKGLEPVMGFYSDLRSAVELDQLNGIGIENRGIPRAIDL